MQVAETEYFNGMAESITYPEKAIDILEESQKLFEFGTEVEDAVERGDEISYFEHERPSYSSESALDL